MTVEAQNGAITTFLVEVYVPRLGEGDVGEAAARAHAAAAEMRRRGIEIAYLRAMFVPEDETCFHVFEGHSDQAVLEAGERAALFPRNRASSVKRLVEQAGHQLRHEERR